MKNFRLGKSPNRFPFVSFAREAARCPGKRVTYPPSPLHQEGQESDGQTRSWCLDKAVLARDAWYQSRSNNISRD